MINIAGNKTSGRPSKIKTALHLILTILCALAFRSFVFEPFHVPSGSMKSTLLEGDYIFVAKYTYGYSRHSLPLHLPIIKGKLLERQPKRGDVVVFVPTGMGNTFFIKRVIGLPGDLVQLKDGTLYINGEQVERKHRDAYLDVDSVSLDRYTEIMGDGRSYSVLQDPLGSFVDNTPEYRVPEGKFFMLGDNRNNSRDSRFMYEIGFVPGENIVGRAVIVALSVSPYKKWYESLRLDRLFVPIDS